MSEKLTPFTKERFDEIKARFESMGYTVISKWRPGLKRIRLSDIVLGERTVFEAAREQIIKGLVEQQIARLTAQLPKKAEGQE